MGKINRLYLFVGIGFVVIAFVIVIVAGGDNNGQANDNKQPEKGGTESAQLLNSQKLDNMLTPAQFYLTQQELASYVSAKYKTNGARLLINSVLLKDDGSIDVQIAVKDVEDIQVVVVPFDPFVIKVPAGGFESSTPNSVLEKMYNGNNVSE